MFSHRRTLSVREPDPTRTRSWQRFAPERGHTERLQRKCACGGTPGPTGECESCRKKRLEMQRQADSSGRLSNRLRIKESAASETEADAIATRVVAGANITTQPGNRVDSQSTIQRQRKPEDILPQRHVSSAPTMRPVGAEMVRGFPVTRATCGCGAEVAEAEKYMTGMTAAYAACGQRKNIRDADALIECARSMAGPFRLRLGAPVSDPFTSTTQFGEAEESNCSALLHHGALLHESRHLEQFDELAGSLGPAFSAEFKKLEGDPQRLEKLRAHFPNETKKYESAARGDLSGRVRMETEAYKVSLDFFQEVRAVWSHLCGSTVPTPEIGPPQGPPGRRELQRHSRASDIVTQEAVPDVVHEVIGSAGHPLGARARAFMEERFGYDFGRVRVHIDRSAAESARTVNANAYTVGSHVAFGPGEYAPHTSRGLRLLAHELAHVVQQTGAEPFVQRETYDGGGYKQRKFGSLDAEIAAGQKKPSEWHPATEDMASTAAGSGGGEAVSTVDDLLTKLESKGKGSVTRLNLIGHSNSSEFSFGGKITKDNVEFTPEASIDIDSLTKNAKRTAALRDRFGEGAKIVLYSCDAGTGQALLDAVGDAFGVCVEGFSSEVWWCLAKKDGKAVRGRVWSRDPNDPLVPDAPTDCDKFASNMTTLVTGGKSKQCGAKKGAP